MKSTLSSRQLYARHVVQLIHRTQVLLRKTESTTTLKSAFSQAAGLTLTEIGITLTKKLKKLSPTYEFEENGKLISGKWYTTEEGTKSYYGPDFYVATRTASVAWAEIDGNTYGFDRNGYRYEGPNYAKESNAPQYMYNFDDDGVYLGKFSGITDLRYFEDGVAVPLNKLIEYDGDYYYVQGNSVLATGTFKVVNGNNIVADNTYREFDKDGKMIVDPAVDGIVKEDGVLRYYINNVIQKGSGLVKVDGDYYYVRSNGVVATGTYMVWNGNGIVEDQTFHEFGADGKMIS